MANDIIKGAGDVYQKDLYGDLSKSAKEVLPLLDKINQVLKATTKSNEALVSVEAKNVESLQKVNQGLQKTDQAFKQKLKLDNERIKVSNQLKSATDEEVKGKIRLQKATKAQRDTLKDELILQDKSAGTLEKVAASSRKLRREREKLNLDTQKGRDRLKEINKQLDLNNKKVLKNSDSLKKQRINVGNYSNSIKDAAGASGLFSGQLAALQRIQATLNAFTKKNTAETQANAAAQRASGKAVSGTSKALKILKIALISTGIGAIVVGLGSLIAAFAGTQRGADAFTKVLRPLQTLFQRFIGFLEGTAFSAFDRLKEAFENPKQAVIDLANAIKNNLIKRFESLSILGGAIVKIFSGDFKEGFKELADGAVQLGTGIENVSEKINNLTEDVKGFVDESIKQGDELDALIKRFERRQIDTVIPLAKARLEFQALRAIAQDQTALDQDRIDALIKAESIQRTIAETENELLQLKIDRVELEQSFNDTSREEELELVKLKADQLNADAAAQKKINGLISLRTGIEKRLLALRQKSNIELVKTTKILEDEEKRELVGVDKIKKAKDKAFSDAVESSKKEIELEDKTAKEKEEIQAQTLKKTEELLNKSFENKINELDEEFNASKENQDRLRELAQKGSLEAQQSITLETKKQADLKRAKEQEERKQELVTAGFKIFSALLDQGKDPSSATLETATLLGALPAIIEAIPAFYEGTESTGKVSNPLDSNGGRLAMLHDNERVMTEKQNNKMGGIGNEEAANIIQRYNMGELFNYNTPVLDSNLMSSISLNGLNKGLERKIDTLNESIKAIKIPETTVNADQLRNLLVIKKKTGNKIEVQKSKLH